MPAAQLATRETEPVTVQSTRCYVCNSPSRNAIDEALLAGAPERTIAKQFGLPRIPIHRHRANGHIRSKLAEAAKVAKVSSAESIAAKLEALLEPSEALLRACRRWLKDPDSDGEMTLDPRTNEVLIDVQRGRSVARMTLAEALRIVREGLPDSSVSLVESKVADPRKLVNQTAETLFHGVELIGRFLGVLRPQQAASEDAAEVQALLDRLSRWLCDRHPELAEEFSAVCEGKPLPRAVLDVTALRVEGELGDEEDVSTP